jgi:hypothetical protein
MAWILRALELYKSFVRPQDTCPMENLAPSKVRDLLHEVLRETAIGTVRGVDPDPTGYFSVFRIRIHLIRIRIQHFRLKKHYFSVGSNYNLPIPRHPERTSKLKKKPSAL